MSTVARKQSVRRGRGRISKLEWLLTHNRPAYKQMLKLLRKGAYLNTAAAAVGIAPETLSRWLAKGNGTDDDFYRQFRQDLLSAVADARVAAEIEVRKSNPLFWLKCGPGRLIDDCWRVE